MTHQENYNLSSSTIDEMTRNGLEAIPELVRVILNSVTQAERSKYLQANLEGQAEKCKDLSDLHQIPTIHQIVCKNQITFKSPTKHSR